MVDRDFYHILGNPPCGLLFMKIKQRFDGIPYFHKQSQSISRTGKGSGLFFIRRQYEEVPALTDRLCFYKNKNGVTQRGFYHPHPSSKYCLYCCGTVVLIADIF